jgi:hypothetical protein
MSEKSHVSMEQRICAVCGTAYETGAILLDRRLRASLERYTTTGWGLCPEHRRLHNEGFVALVECDLSKSDPPLHGSELSLEGAYRTGRTAHLRREDFARIFNTSLSPDLPCVFVGPDVIEKLQKLGGLKPPDHKTH